MAVSFESPFLDAESFASDAGPQPGRPSSTETESTTSDSVDAYEQFEQLRELWTPGQYEFDGGEPETSSGAGDQPEAFEDEDGDNACTDSGYGIIGSDDRRKVANTVDVPFRWICQLWVRRTDANGKVTDSGGTGVLISPRHVLTVAHLVREDKKDNRNHWVSHQATQIRVTPGRDGGDRPLGTYDVKLPAQVSPHWDPRTMPHGQDYALLTLDTAIGDRAFKALGGNQLGYWGSRANGAGSSFRRVPPGPLNGRTATTAGYPKDKGRETPYVTAGQIMNATVHSRTMNISADACQGQSGSPIWLTVDNERCLVGLMVAVGRGTNIALRVTDELCAQLRTWMKGASDACAPRAAASAGAARPQPELEAPKPARCRCGGHESAGELEAGSIIDAARIERDAPPVASQWFAGEDEEQDRDELETAADEYSAGGLGISGASQREDGDLGAGEGWDDASELQEPEDEADFEDRELDPVLMDLAERTMAHEAPFVEGQAARGFTTCFSAADSERVKKAYADNAAAAAASDGDRCSCIVMLNVALGQLLPLRVKEHRARGTSNRRVSMGALATASIEQAMQQLRTNGLAAAPTIMNFLDRRNRTAGTLKPERLKASVQDRILALSRPGACWFAYGLSIMDGYHSVLLLVDRTTASGTIYWLDQFTSGLNDDVTSTLDQRITDRTQVWWQKVMDRNQKGYDTTIRIWPLRKPRRAGS